MERRYFKCKMNEIKKATTNILHVKTKKHPLSQVHRYKINHKMSRNE
jgi:hypothetical protein